MDEKNASSLRMVSRKEMQALDRYAIEEIGIPGIVLMENAALKILAHLELDQHHSFAVFCGTGNNGGDGLAVARHLLVKGKKVRIVVVGELDQERISEEYRINYGILCRLGADIVTVSSKDELETIVEVIKESDLVIDAIFGIGLDREIRGIHYWVIDSLNQFSKKIIAVDVPSGIDGDTGLVLGIAVKATKTIMLQCFKKGLSGIPQYTGDIIVEDIGIPEKPVT